MDGKKESIKTNILLISNFSNLGVANLITPRKIDPQDSKIDLITINDPFSIKHRQFKKLTVKTSKEKLWSTDDKFKKLIKIDFEVLSKKVKLITPKN